MVILSGCFEAHASSCHASFCSWTIGHAPNGSPDSHCKGELLKHLLHFTPSLLHQWIQLRFLLSLIKIEALWPIFFTIKMQLKLCSENILSLTLNCLILFSSPVPVPKLPSECSSSQLPPPQSEQPEILPPRKITRSHFHHRFHSFSQDPEAFLMDKMVWHLPTSPEARLYYGVFFLVLISRFDFAVIMVIYFWLLNNTTKGDL